MSLNAIWYMLKFSKSEKVFHNFQGMNMTALMSWSRELWYRFLVCPRNPRTPRPLNGRAESGHDLQFFAENLKSRTEPGSVLVRWSLVRPMIWFLLIWMNFWHVWSKTWIWRKIWAYDHPFMKNLIRLNHQSFNRSPRRLWIMK